MKQDIKDHAQIPIVSIDVPSGWDVQHGNLDNKGLDPELLISLTYPKECARFYMGRHFLGGRFISPRMAAKYDLDLPEFPEGEQCVELPLDHIDAPENAC